MVTLGPIRVVSSTHATDQALRRVSMLSNADRQGAVYWVEQTAARALRDGRRARRCPRWCVREWGNGFSARGRLTQEGLVRFLWNEAESVAFIAAHVPDARRGGRVWVIKTVITPG